MVKELSYLIRTPREQELVLSCRGGKVRSDEKEQLSEEMESHGSAED